MAAPGRSLLRAIRPHGIPWPFSLLYARLSRSDPFQRHYRLAAEDIATRCPAGHVMDVGTGPGWLLLDLHEQAPGLRLSGVDISPSMVATARKNIANAGLSLRIEVREARASQLPFPDESFEAVVSTGALHHWKNPVSCLNDAHRVLKKNGVALVYDLVQDAPEAAVRELGGLLAAFILRLHIFLEPSCTTAGLEELARASAFGEGETHFVGALCCLAMRKR